jgi:hypothetical protein
MAQAPPAAAPAAPQVDPAAAAAAAPASTAPTPAASVSDAPQARTEVAIETPQQEPQAAIPEAPAPVPPAEPPPPRDRVAVDGDGFVKWGALLQGWIFVEHQHGLTEQRNTASTARVRRAELKMSGEIVPKVVGYGVMVDPAKAFRWGSAQAPVAPQQDPPATVTVPTAPADNSILQDFYITYLNDYAEVSLGQFKIPVSWEGFNSSSKLTMPERALVARTYGDRRDLGLRAEKKFDSFGYVAGVYNGEGLNRLDSNNQKDVTLRLEAYPTDGLMIGAVGYLAVGERQAPDVFTKDRAEADLRFERKGVLLQAEYIHFWDKPAGAERTEGHGSYAMLGYTFADVVQPVVRVGFLDKDIDAAATLANDEVWVYEAGLNYYVKQNNMKLQASLSRFDWHEASPDTQGIFAAQVAF